MNKKGKINRKLLFLLASAVLFCSVCLGLNGTIVKAKGEAVEIDAEMLASGKNTYDIRVTVENHGADWEGIVRLRASSMYGCAYDTVISLPTGSTKQFVVKIPRDSIASTSGIVKISLIDKEQNVTAQKEFERLLQEQAVSLYMGILSDNYSMLTYLDMGGNEFHYNGHNFPIKLTQLDQSNLSASLASLNFLIIDSYNTSVLSEEMLEDIKQWINDGGILIVGTGDYADDVLSGLDSLEIECTKVYEPEESDNDFTNVDLSDIHIAELVDKNDTYSTSSNVSSSAMALLTSWGNGAIEVLPYSLLELGTIDSSKYYLSQEYFVEWILEDATGYANTQNNSTQYNYDDTEYMLQRMFSLFGNGNNNLYIGGLKWIVILYVIFVGPILYLILRFIKKRDFYWVAVPISTLVGILLVYWSGRGFELKNTNIYSVTMENLSENDGIITYLRGYNAGYKEWDLCMAEDYEYVGAFDNSNYNYYYYSSNYNNNDNGYYHHISKQGDRIFFGIKPNAGFDDGYFMAGIDKSSESGTIKGDFKLSNQKEIIGGTVFNGTDKDFKYFAVVLNYMIYIYKDLPAGETIDLDKAQVEYNMNDSYYSYRDTPARTYLYDYLSDYMGRKNRDDLDMITALGMGVSHVYLREEADTTVIIGVTDEWDKVVDDNCSEVSYGCLYAIQ